MSSTPRPSSPSAVFDRATAVGTSRVAPGTLVGRYRLDEFLGRGGMGEVWKAFDPVVETHLVVKLLPPELSASATEVERVRLSFRKVAELPHQHICPVYQFDVDPVHGPYLTMKFVPGIPLSLYRLRYVERHGAFPAAEAVRVLRPVAAALDYAHEKGVIHRDVKPENVLVRPDGSDPQLVDFGLAADIQRSLSRVSQVRWETSGTLAYMSPEQWRGRLQNGKTDQYALAAVAYELLTGQPPFDVADKDVLGRCVLGEAPPDLPGDPARGAVLARGLAKEVADRYPTCAALVDALANPPPPPPKVVPKSGAPAGRGVLWSWVQSAVAASAILAGVWYFTRPTGTTTAGPSPAAPPQTAAAAAQPNAAPPAAPAATPTPGVMPTPPVNPPVNPHAAPVAATPTPAPPQPAAPTVVPVDLLTAAQQADAVEALRTRLAPLAADAEGWRKQLTGLAPPGESPEAAALHKKLLDARNAFALFAGKYAPLDTELRASPPQTRAAATALATRLDALVDEKVEDRTLAAWKSATAEDHAAYTRLLANAESARMGNLAQFTDRVRATAKALCAAAEAADTKGYDADTEAVKEVRKTLFDRRKEVRAAVEALGQIEREVLATTPPDRTRLAELQATLRDLTIPDAAWCQETGQMAQQVKAAAEAARIAFDARVATLGLANREAQWFVCTDANGQAIAIEEPERARLTLQGRPPYVDDEPSHTIRFSSSFQSYVNPFHELHKDVPFAYFNKQQTREVRTLDGEKENIPALKEFGRNRSRDSWQFAYKAGIERQKYVPFNDRNPKAVADKQQEMRAALAAWLNPKFPGLNLTADDVTVTWKRLPDRAEEDEMWVTLENMFGGFRVAVVVPRTPPPGLVGEGDAAFRALVEEARRLAKGGSTAPAARAVVNLPAGSVWRGTITQRGQTNQVVVTFAEVNGTTVRGRIETRGRNGSGVVNSAAFSGVLSGAEVALVTRAPATGSPLLGAEWKGRIDGDTLAGRWDYGTDDGGQFSLTLGRAAP